MGARLLFLLALQLGSSACFAQRLVKHAEQEFLPLRTSLRHMYDSLILAGDSSVYQEGGDYTEFRKWEEFWATRLKNGDSFIDYERAYARSRVATDLKSAESNTTDWHEVGPKDLPFGSVQLGQGSGYGIGPIRFLTLNGQYPDTMLCGSHSGGLFYTVDEGVNWRMAGSDTWARSGCQYAVFNAADPCIWYAANSGYWGYAGGIYRTLDCGESWELIADQNDFYSGGVWTFINQLVPDHTDTNVLYATSEHQLWRTNNANDPDPVWEIVEIPLPPSIDNHPTYGTYYFPEAQNVYDMVLDPLHNDTMYVAARFEGALNETTPKVRYWRLLGSFDRGETWDEIPGQPSPSFTLGIPDHRDEFRRWDRNADHLTIEGSIETPLELHVLYDMVGDGVDELWRLIDATTGTWPTTPLKDNIYVLYGGGHGFGVSQTNGEDVFLDHNVNPNTGQIGRYLTYVNGIWTNYYGNSNYLQYHVDVEDFIGHPTEPGEIWLADHGGIHRSTDSGQSWEWRGRGLAVAEPWRMTDSYANDDHVLIGLFHEASVLSQPDYSPEWIPEWRQLPGGDGQKPIIDPDEPNRMFWSSQGGSWYRSANYGQSSNQLSGEGPGDWNSEGAMDRGIPNALYIPAWFYHPVDSVYHCEIRRSFDHWTTKDTISDFYPTLGADKWIWRIYPAWSNPNYLYAYFPDGPRLMRTTIARVAAPSVRSSWHAITGALPRTAWVSDIDFDHEDPNILYVAYSSASMDVDTSIGTGMLFRVDLNDTSNVIVTDLTGSDTTWTPLPNTGEVVG